MILVNHFLSVMGEVIAQDFLRDDAPAELGVAVRVSCVQVSE